MQKYERHIHHMEKSGTFLGNNNFLCTLQVPSFGNDSSIDKVGGPVKTRLKMGKKFRIYFHIGVTKDVFFSFSNFTLGGFNQMVRWVRNNECTSCYKSNVER